MLSNVILSIVGIRNVLIINLMLLVYIAVGDPTVRKRIANHHVTVNYFCLFSRLWIMLRILETLADIYRVGDGLGILCPVP